MPESGASPLVSVVIPAYNRADSIAAAIDSVLRQSFCDFELLVVDDGSTDGTQSVVRGIDDPRLRLIEVPHNMGAGAARNLGIEAARGEWIAFQDSDDEWLPLKLEKQMARVSASGAGYIAVYCGMIVLGRVGIDYGSGPGTAENRIRVRYFPTQEETAIEGDLLLPLLRTSLISTQTLVARRDALRAIGGFDPAMRALIDWDCTLRLAPLGPIACVDEPLVMQRFSANSITRDRSRRLHARTLIAEKNAALLEAHPTIAAFHHSVIANDRQADGDFAGARADLNQARRLQPRNPRYWAKWLYVSALALRPRRPSKSA